MHWMVRNGRRYAYKSRRVDGRIIKEYIGTGKRAEILVQQDLAARIQRGVEQQQWLCAWSKNESARQPLDALCGWSRLLTHAVLVLGGCYLHKGHEWRPRGKHG